MTSLRTFLITMCLLSITLQSSSVILQSRDGDMITIDDTIAYNKGLSTLYQRFNKAPRADEGVIILERVSSFDLQLLQQLLEFANNIKVYDIAQADIDSESAYPFLKRELQIQETYNQFKDIFDLEDEETLATIAKVANRFNINIILAMLGQAMIEKDLGILTNYLEIKTLDRYGSEVPKVLIEMYKKRIKQIKVINEIVEKEQAYFDELNKKHKIDQDRERFSFFQIIEKLQEGLPHA